MSQEANADFSEEEKDILQEIMNIAFGNATADLAEVIDIYVMLSVPNIKAIAIGALPEYLKKTINEDIESSIIEQKFWGNFKGSGLLVFPSGSGKDILAFLDKKESKDYNGDAAATLEKGGLLEIGNILIGACVGKVSELLNTFVTYSPPQVIQSEKNEFNHLIEHFDPQQSAIVMKTIFTFKEKDISGFLLILTNHESIGWLRKALNDFMDSYE
ncbi:MAG: chemotaxis protein CheC [Deltaproteobacteria bacterium]|nr:chemotaxis protein CheC [Deltaproteobacteria bacterium]